MDLIPGRKSDAVFRRARKAMPGGVSSPVRAYQAVGGVPPVVRKAEGAYIEDEDGNRYIDFVMSWGPLILGHAHPEVIRAVESAAKRGTTYGAICVAEVEMAERVIESYPGIEQVRFVSTGTEATMSAIRLARGITGRDVIVKFSGCYHGHVDHLLVAAGSGLATFGTPSSAGVPSSFAGLTRVLPLDDEARLADLFTEEGRQIAAVIIEPVPANNGLLIQRESFLRALRRETERAGALLIFDEVITGFRLSRGGAAALLGITPDLVTLGKVIGGGLPVGAFAGRRELLEYLAPNGPVYQAGTLSGNPVAMAAGLATLTVLEREDGWQQLEILGKEFEACLVPVLKHAPFHVHMVRVGSLFWFSFQEGNPPRTAENIDQEAADRYRLVFHGLLQRGIALAPSAYEVGFLSLAHRREHFERLTSALSEIFSELV